MEKRLYYMDWLKGFTMLMVIIGHALFGMYSSNAFSGEETFLYYSKEVLYSFHMPIFFMVSGFFYSDKHFTSIKKRGEYVLHKLAALGVPYVTFSVIQILLQLLGGDSVRATVSTERLFTIAVFPVDHLWFLYALFLCFLVCVLLDGVVRNEYAVFSICVLLAFLWMMFKPNIPVLQYVLRYPFFFYLGKMISRDKVRFDKQWYWLVGMVLLVILNVIPMWTSYEVFGSSYITGVGGIYCFMAMGRYFADRKKDGYGLVRLGRMTMPVYLFHAPIMSVSRIVLLRLGVTNTWLVLIILVSFSLFCSVVIYGVVRKVPFLEFFIFPLKREKSK